MKPPIEIIRPCTACWNVKTGDVRKRLCALCGKHVLDLPAFAPSPI